MPSDALPRLVSGGQTGADRAALDVAAALDLPASGWCPGNRMAEDGRIDDRYPVRPLPGGDHAARTRRNVIQSDATLIVSPEPIRGGTALARRTAEEHGRPSLHLDPEHLTIEQAARRLRRFLGDHDVRSLNVAGPRESEHPGTYRYVRDLLLYVADRS